jgi:ElaB/YqjD/DUF883 family membrane-anchored ribosome-binding protein
MKTEVTSGSNAGLQGQRYMSDSQTHTYDSNKEKLLTDLRIVVADTQQLIKEAVDSSSEGLAALRTRFEQKLSAAKATLESARATVAGNARCAAAATSTYVKENPWQFAGVAVATGLIVGFLLSRR